MPAAALTTLANVKEWLGSTSATADPLLGRLIRAASAMVLQHLNLPRGFVPRTIDERYDGYGKPYMLMRPYPVIELLELSTFGNPISQAAGDGILSQFSNGWVLESADAVTCNQRVTLYGRWFPVGKDSIFVRSRVGYEASDTYVVDTSGYTPDSVWTADGGVVGPGGALLTKVSSSPTSGQYAVDESGHYQFSADDTGDSVSITYGYVPEDIEQAVYELVGERYQAMDRVGYVSKSLGGQETVTFSQKAMSDYIAGLLQPYVSVVPV